MQKITPFLWFDNAEEGNPAPLWTFARPCAA